MWRNVTVYKQAIVSPHAQDDVNKFSVLIGVYCDVKLHSMKRENQKDASRCLLLLLSQHVSGIILPIFRRTKALLLHLVLFCNKRENVGISRDVFFV